MRIITVARKPIAGSVIQTAIKWGTGGLNIDASRIPVDPVADASQLRTMNRSQKTESNGWGMNQNDGDVPEVVSSKGRWPANVILLHHAQCNIQGCPEVCPIKALDEDVGVLKSGVGAIKAESSKGYRPTAYGGESCPVGSVMITYGDTGMASRFFKQIGKG